MEKKFKFISLTREFFTQKGFVDVLIPPLVSCPVIEPFVQPLKVVGENIPDKTYLQTSPEFWMKDLLSRGLENIFTISYCFRDEPESPLHRPQFIMLEWYRLHHDTNKIIADLAELTTFLLSSFGKSRPVNMVEKTVQDLFHQHLQMDILEFPKASQLREYIRKNHSDIPLPTSDLSWDDYYHLIFLNKIEPFLSEDRFLILKEYPAQLRALSRLKKEDPRVCERFEFFVDGVEIANCYGELTDPEEQEQCFHSFNQMRKENNKEIMPRPSVLLTALERGLPDCCGAALGVERLMKVLLGESRPFFG